MEDKEELIIEIKVNNTMYIVNIPKKEEKLYLTMDKNTQEFKNIKELIIGLYKEITSQKLDSFIKKTKNKM